MEKKYTFTSETIKYKGYTLHRIKALKDIVINTEITIEKGSLGGWIEKEYNLSQDGNCWVSGKAKVFGDAIVKGCAYVSDYVEVHGNAIIREHAEIHGTACLKEGTFQGTINISETNVLKETKHFMVEVFKINSDLSREKIKTIYINTDINDIDYLSFLIKQKHKLDNIPVSLKFIEEYNCYEDFMKQ